MFLMKVVNFMKFIFFRVGFSVGISLLVFNLTFCQGIAIGQWREHLPYSQVLSVEDIGSKVYAATPFAIFCYEKHDFSVSRLSKVNILSDIGITRIAYHLPQNTLIIAYENGNIDLLHKNNVFNVNDIKRANIIGSKRINNIYIKGDSVYFSCDFGIAVYNLLRSEFVDTYFIGPNGQQIPVYDMDFLHDTIYAGTSIGLLSASVNSNLADFNNWRLDTLLLRPGFKFNLVKSFNNKLIVNITKNQWNADTAYIKDNSVWQKFLELLYTKKTQFKSYNNKFVVAQMGLIGIFDENLQEIYRLWFFNDNFLMPNDFCKDKYHDNIWWIGDDNLCLIRNENQWTNKYICLGGPYTEHVYSLASKQGNIIGVPGGRNSFWGNLFRHTGYFLFKNERWTSMNQNHKPAFDTIYDAMSVVFHPTISDRWYIGSYSKGIIEITNHNITNIFHSENTTMTGVSGSSGIDVRVGGLAFDKNNNLWATTSMSTHCIHVKTPQNIWYSYDIPIVTSGDIFSSLIIDRWNNKWLIMPKGGGILVFNENNTFDNRTDDKYIKLNTSVGSGNLPSGNVNCIVYDKDDRVWIGTDKGIAVFYNPQNIFTGGNFDAEQILVEVGGYVMPLMESETVNSLVIDGANRKWVATDKGGVFLLSADGTEQIYHFTSENSPLLSNSVGTIAIMPETGEVFFGTYKGLISYKSTATEAPPSYHDTVNVYAYPNPVKPGYNGTIAIKNLVYNSDVKITDISGNLIHKTRSHGGQAVWDGKLPNGQKPKSGVFLVFATDSDGQQTIVTKILFIQ